MIVHIIYFIVLNLGFDIAICHFTIEDGKAIDVVCLTHTYLSYNCGDYAEHFLYGEGKCPEGSNCIINHLWYFNADCHSRRSDDIIIRIEKALKILESNNGKDSNWIFGYKMMNLLS